MLVIDLTWLGACLIRRCFPAVVRVLDQIVANLAAMPAGSELDVNNVTLRLALDITGARLGNSSKSHRRPVTQI